MIKMMSKNDDDSNDEESQNMNKDKQSLNRRLCTVYKIFVYILFTILGLVNYFRIFTRI